MCGGGGERGRRKPGGVTGFRVAAAAKACVTLDALAGLEGAGPVGRGRLVCPEVVEG